MSDVYKELSLERKALQANGFLPAWFQTGSWQMFKASYLHEADNWYEQIARISSSMAKHAPRKIPKKVQQYGDTWEEIFNNIINSGDFVLPTPTLANAGTSRGMTVSCAGQYIGNSIDSFYKGLHEAAMLSKNGFGTSGYFDVQSRGTSISKGGKASGIAPVIDEYWNMAGNVSQGGVRRGSFGGYINIEQGDFREILANVKAEPFGRNIGINISTKAGKAIVAKTDHELVERFQLLMELRMMGRGYINRPDLIAESQPEMYKKLGLKNWSTGLCNEIVLAQDEENTYSCVLGAVNVSRYKKWKPGLIFAANVFLDCNVSYFLEEAKGKSGFEKIVKTTAKGRAIGLGVTGYHTYLQLQSIVFGDFESMSFNNKLWKQMQAESLEASKWLAAVLEEPEWCKGYGVRNTHRLAQAPNKSSSLIAGQVSEGINPIYGNIFMQNTSVGMLQRINPVFIKILKEKGKFNKKVIASVEEENGSCQHLDFLTEHEKAVFRTAFEIPQIAILAQGEQRAGSIDQGQSLNFFISQNTKAADIMSLHLDLLENNKVKGAYYITTTNSDVELNTECLTCAN